MEYWKNGKADFAIVGMATTAELGLKEDDVSKFTLFKGYPDVNMTHITKSHYSNIPTFQCPVAFD
jgi:hypothetical protein